MTSHNLPLRQPECNLAGYDVKSLLTTDSQHKPYGHQGCYLVEKIVSNILKKAHYGKFDKEWMQFIDFKVYYLKVFMKTTSTSKLLVWVGIVLIKSLDQYLSLYQI